MFQKKTTIILGAGASAECNLPTGYQLKNSIASLLNIKFEHGNSLKSGDGLICEALRVAVKKLTPGSRDITPHIHAARRIANAMPQAISIDNFIDSHQGQEDLELCGKLAIVRAILMAERQSSLYCDSGPGRGLFRFDQIQETWYAAFLQLVTENCRLDNLPDRLRSISIIDFNYDRCIEEYLYHAIGNYYGLGEKETADLVGHVRIFHPYGYVGDLPWKKPGFADFGVEPGPHQLLSLASEIKTFTEGMDPTSSDIVAIHETLASSEIVLFLGFAYHVQNLKLLHPATLRHSNPTQVRYFGTAFGLSESDCTIIRKDLAKLAGVAHANIELRRDLKCASLFREYWRSLSLS